MRRRAGSHRISGKNSAHGSDRCLRGANVWDVWLTRTTNPRRRRCEMSSDPPYQALFLGAGSQMQCGVGQFTRLLCETIEKIDPGSCTTLTLTRTEGSASQLW